MRRLLASRSVTMILAVVVFAMAVPAMAADPIIGSWKTNVAKSKFSPLLLAALKRAPKERTEVYREIEGDQIEMAATEIGTDGSPQSGKLVWPRQGGTARGALREGPVFVEVLTDPGNWYVAILMDGKQTALLHKTISKDGRTMRQTTKGTTPDGKTFEQIEVFDRQ